MSDTTDTASSDAPSAGKKRGLNSMLLPELRQVAGGLGIKTAGLRKGDLVEAIKAAQSGTGSRQQGWFGQVRRPERQGPEAGQQAVREQEGRPAGRP